MSRQLHRWPTLIFGVLLVVLSVTGSILALDPVLKRFDRYVMDPGVQTVGDLLELSAQRNPYFMIDRLRVDYSGRVLVRGADAGGSREVPINPETGRIGRVRKDGPFWITVRDLHRALLLGPDGRPITLAASLAMLAVLVTGAILILRRLGGASRLFAPVGGRGISKLHAYLGRLLILPMIVVVFSGTWMALVSNSLLPSGQESQPVAPDTKIEAESPPATDLAVFDTVLLRDLTSLSFPIDADWFDVYRLRIGGQIHFIDRNDGEILTSESVGFWTRALDLFTLLHTGQGASVWGAIAGLIMLCVPFFTITGVILWVRGRPPRARGTVRSAQTAEIGILVGSENGTTWGFATYLAERLVASGKRVFLSDMNARPTFAKDAVVLVLAATYGDGAPPASGRKFLANLPKISGAGRYAVLGFGDKSFAAYCAFADACDGALAQSGRARLLPMADINRRSSQSFAAWGRAVGPELGVPDLQLEYVPKRPKTRQLVLDTVTRFESAGAPAAILRLRPVGRFQRFQAGDLLAVVPPGDPVERYYSLGSSAAEGFVELCVVQLKGGICSTHLIGLDPGATIDAYVAPNPDFRPAPKAPTIMIGAGTGVAPFAGMIRQNRGSKLTLYQGMRHPDHDHYFGGDIAVWRKDGRLRAYHPAFSRHQGRTYVQDLVRANSTDVAADLRAGGVVMVCGSLAMASAVAAEIDQIAHSIGGSVAQLRRDGRYLEDIY